MITLFLLNVLRAETFSEVLLNSQNETTVVLDKSVTSLQSTVAEVIFGKSGTSSEVARDTNIVPLLSYS